MTTEADNNTALIQEAYRRSELRLSSQLTAALAADARAMAFAGLTLAAAAILCGLAKDATSPTAMLLGSCILVVSACLAGFSARPVDFFMPGARFDDLDDDIEKDERIESVLAQLGGFHDKHTEENDKLLNMNGKFLLAAFAVAIAGIFVAIFPQIGALAEVVQASCRQSLLCAEVPLPKRIGECCFG